MPMYWQYGKFTELEKTVILIVRESHDPDARSRVIVWAEVSNYEHLAVASPVRSDFSMDFQWFWLGPEKLQRVCESLCSHSHTWLRANPEHQRARIIHTHGRTLILRRRQPFHPKQPNKSNSKLLNFGSGGILSVEAWSSIGRLMGSHWTISFWIVCPFAFSLSSLPIDLLCFSFLVLCFSSTFLLFHMHLFHEHPKLVACLSCKSFSKVRIMAFLASRLQGNLLHQFQTAEPILFIWWAREIGQ